MLKALIARTPLWIWFVLFLAASVPIGLSVQASLHGDVQLYHRAGEELSRGVMPYRDHDLEYPPYAVPIFLLPYVVGGTIYEYQLAFSAFVAVADSLLKCLLLLQGLKQRDRLTGLLPLAVYSGAVPFICYFYLQRYDIFPAVLTVVALLCFGRNWFGWAGAILAVAAGMKLYPALLGPVLWVVAVRRGGGARFAAGTILALLPLVALSFFLPWWRFLAFHNERGLQVESLYASAIWLLHHLGWVQAQWSPVKAWTEVSGRLASALVAPAKVTMAGTTLFSVAFASWAGSRVRGLDVFGIARLSLIPLLAFVGFNIVLSPQYMIWLLPLASLGILGGSKWPMVLIAVATAVTPIFYPSPEYVSGLNLFQTLVLLGRNLSLIVVWVVLMVEFWRKARAPEELAPAK